jgi:oligo-1,6-glucosidase
MHFWLQRGASGFRMDVINLISKVDSFPNAEETLGDDHEFHPGNKYFVNVPRFHEFMKEMYYDVLSKYDCFTGIPTHAISEAFQS